MIGFRSFQLSILYIAKFLHQVYLFKYFLKFLELGQLPFGIQTSKHTYVLYIHSFYCIHGFFIDLSHNKISDSGARAIGKLINGRCRLTELDISDNKIRSQGAAAVGHALGKNTTLTSVNLRLNR